ncbi:MAG: hypothetical protein D6744_07820 [Planctomycetota bacterium]|nr:MAG: hypothetical protein D6744_07820 [Planctomycetota bacterium]
MMGLSKRRTLLLTSLGVSMLIWLADALFNGGASGPTRAQATVADPPAAATPATKKTKTPQANTDYWLALLREDPRRRSPVPLGRFRRDPFEITDAMIRKLKLEARGASAVEAQNPEPEAPPETPFGQRHVLRAVVFGREPCAVVDGVIMTIGSELDGYRLVSIDREAVVFEREGDRRRLVIPPPLAR